MKKHECYILSYDNYDYADSFDACLSQNKKMIVYAMKDVFEQYNTKYLELISKISLMYVKENRQFLNDNFNHNHWKCCWKKCKE